jgi:hypothetical protein
MVTDLGSREIAEAATAFPATVCTANFGRVLVRCFSLRYQFYVVDAPE